MRARRVFLSYSWDDEAHRAWVERLAQGLLDRGLEVRLDRWHCEPGDSITHFMETEIAAADAVVVVCTPAYANKAAARQGGGGFELDIISGFIFGGASRRKFIPILRRGEARPGPGSGLPVLFQGAHWLDFRADERYASSLAALVSALGAHGGELDPPPPLPPPIPKGPSVPENPHLLPEPEQVEFVRRCAPKQVDSFWIPDSLVVSMAAFTGDEAAARAIVNKANRLRQLADPAKPPQAITLGSLPSLGQVGAQSFWMTAYVSSAARGGRMLAALLLATPDPVFEDQVDQILPLLRKILEVSR